MVAGLFQEGAFDLAQLTLGDAAHGGCVAHGEGVALGAKQRMSAAVAVDSPGRNRHCVCSSMPMAISDSCVRLRQFLPGQHLVARERILGRRHLRSIAPLIRLPCHLAPVCAAQTESNHRRIEPAETGDGYPDDARNDDFSVDKGSD